MSWEEGGGKIGWEISDRLKSFSVWGFHIIRMGNNRPYRCIELQQTRSPLCTTFGEANHVIQNLKVMQYSFIRIQKQDLYDKRFFNKRKCGTNVAVFFWEKIFIDVNKLSLTVSA